MKTILMVILCMCILKVYTQSDLENYLYNEFNI